MDATTPLLPEVPPTPQSSPVPVEDSVEDSSAPPPPRAFCLSCRQTHDCLEAKEITSKNLKRYWRGVCAKCKKPSTVPCKKAPSVPAAAAPEAAAELSTVEPAATAE